MTRPAPLIVGNWKMYGLREKSIALVKSIEEYIRKNAVSCEVAVCPPATLISTIAEALKSSSIAVGGQDCHELAHGPYTGDISPESLKELGCRYVIVGHSERRKFHQETNTLVARKAKAAIQQGLIPIICIGESLEEREAGKEKSVIDCQLQASLPNEGGTGEYVLAYEPIWAIGTGKTATPEQIGEMHRYIRSHWKEGSAPRILYGGSAKANNAREILSVEGVDGLLVGGASLLVEDFCTIIQAACDKAIAA